jgi:hypothetical protein
MDLSSVVRIIAISNSSGKYAKVALIEQRARNVPKQRGVNFGLDDSDTGHRDLQIHS